MMTLLATWKQRELNPYEAMAQASPLMAEKKLNTHKKTKQQMVRFFLVVVGFFCVR
jgi:hypothetical protein